MTAAQLDELFVARRCALKRWRSTSFAGLAGSHDLQYLRLAVARQRHVTDLLPKIACASGETCDNVPRDYTKGTNFCLVRAEEMTF
jgi:hypothetical protein